MNIIRFVLLFLLTLLLSACAMAEEEPSDLILPSTSIKYSSSELVYTFDNEVDLLYTSTHDSTDFLFYIEINEYALSDVQQTAFEDTFDVLDVLQEQTSFTYQLIQEYSTEDILDFADDAALELSPTVLFVFNDLKTIDDKISEQNGTIVEYVNRYDYYEYRLERALTDEEILHLETLQEYYYEMVLNGYDYPLNVMSLDRDAFFNDMESILNTTFSETDLSNLHQAVDIVQQLHQS